MDLTERLTDSINQIKALPMHCYIGYVMKQELLSLYTLPGGRAINTDWAGNKEKEIQYEVAITTINQEKAEKALWLIANHIEQLENIGLKSENHSFIFEAIEISGTPFISEQDSQGYTTYLLDFKITVIQKERK